MKAFLAICLCLALALPVSAQSAREAREAILSAADLLEASETAGDRIAALTQAIRAYEAGLSAMRSELRRLTLRQRNLSEGLAEEEGDISTLLAMMQNATSQTEAQSLLHPGGAVDTIRAGTLASVLVPALFARAAELEDRLVALDEVEIVLSAARDGLADGLAGVRQARRLLSDALAERAELPPRLATSDAAMQALINSAETLSGLADSLVPPDAEAGSVSDAAWLPPVAGQVLRSFGSEDARGVARPGWGVATEAAALVTAPADVTVRFSDVVPGQGRVVVLEADGQRLIVLAGLSESFARLGEVLAAGAPVGFAGIGQMAAQDNLNAGEAESSLLAEETLYIEIRQAGAPVDPATLLTLEQEQG